MNDDLIYRHAVTEDGEPVAVTEPDWSTVAERFDDGAVKRWATRPCSWALILPGDTVRWTVTLDAAFPDAEMIGFVSSILGGSHVNCLLHGDDDPWELHPEDLTLVCGSPEDNPHRFGDNTNPAWRWD